MIYNSHLELLSLLTSLTEKMKHYLSHSPVYRSDHLISANVKLLETPGYFFFFNKGIDLLRVFH